MIDVIHLTLTGTHRDGEWLRVRRWGMHFADLRTVEQLAKVVDLATLDEALGGAGRWLVGVVTALVNMNLIQPEARRHARQPS
jgi:hypothetical protein